MDTACITCGLDAEEYFIGPNEIIRAAANTLQQSHNANQIWNAPSREQVPFNLQCNAPSISTKCGSKTWKHRENDKSNLLLEHQPITLFCSTIPSWYKLRNVSVIHQSVTQHPKTGRPKFTWTSRRVNHRMALLMWDRLMLRH